MKIDSAGNLFSCGPGGMHVFDPDGVSLGVIRMPEPTANFTWGGDDYPHALHHRLELALPRQRWRCRAGRSSDTTAARACGGGRAALISPA